MSPENQQSVTGSAGTVPAVVGSEVPGSARVVLGVAVPDTVEGTIEVFKAIERYSEQLTSVVFWSIGELLLHLEGLGVKEPELVVSAKTRYKERALRYARAVRRTFTQERVIRLANLGLTWTTLRELPSDALEPHREHLLALFEHGRLTDEELRQQVLALRRAGNAADGSDGNPGDGAAEDDALLMNTAATISAQASKLKQGIVESLKGLRPEGRLSKALSSLDGQLREKAEEQLTAMGTALQKEVVEAIELIYRTSTLIVETDFPLQELEDRLAVLRQDFEAEDQAARADGAQPA